MSIIKNGTILNRNQYRITKFIAQGGFGITYLAEEIGYYKQSGYGEEYVEAKNPEIVVIKELYYNDYCQRDEQTGLVSISNVDKKQEFQKLVKNQVDEGKTIRGLQHRNIIRTRDIFHENETAYMVMDYVESTDLEEMLKEQGHLGKEKSMKYINQMLDAIDYIHTKIDKKILHLDISPSNILIDKQNDDAILIDFGSALSYDNVQNNITSTTSQIVTGRKKHYSPNEQGDIDNLKSFDATFDTYAIGATLYHLLSGEKPPLSSMVSTGREKIIPPSHIRKDGVVSEYMDAVIMKSIAPFYRDRYSSAQAFSDALAGENQYNEQIGEIKKLVAENRMQDAKNLINQTIDKFLKTPDLQKLEEEIQQKLEQERKDREYAIFLKKGDNMLAAGELEMALDYYSTAKDIFPDNPEIISKIKNCEQKIAEQKLEQESKSTERSSINIEDAGATELLTPQSKTPSEPIQEATELLSKPSEPKQTAHFKEEVRPIPVTETATQKKTVSSQNAPKKSNKGILIGGIAAGLVAISGILYAMGIFNPKEPEKPVVNMNEQQVSTPIDSVKVDNPSIETTAQVAVTNSEENKPELKETKTDNAWKTKFETSYSAILSAEKKLTSEAAITKYRVLLNSLPSDAFSEKERVNYRIAALNQKIKDQKKEAIAKTEENTTSKTTEKKISTADMDQYNKDLQWAKNMINVDGCKGCKENDVCRSQVTARLKSALAKNPNGTEARNLLDCIN